MANLERDEADVVEQEPPRRHLTDAVLRVPVSHVPMRPALCFPPDTLIQDVIEAMREHHREAVQVCDRKNRKLLGIFTERDLLLRVAGHGWNFREHRISEVMTPNPECVQPHDTIGRALNKMLTHGYRHLPVYHCTSDKCYANCTLLSVRDLLQYLCEYFPEDVLNLPPGNSPPKEREGG